MNQAVLSCGGGCGGAAHRNGYSGEESDSVNPSHGVRISDHCSRSLVPREVASLELLGFVEMEEPCLGLIRVLVSASTCKSEKIVFCLRV